jgi:MFS family permease
VFFFASAGASAAYLTVSEIFPLETRALCIAVFYAVGTGIGGVIGPQVFSRLINTGSYYQVFLAVGLGAVMMILCGVAELLFGIKSERQSLESIAQPLTVGDRGGKSGSRVRCSRRRRSGGGMPQTRQICHEIAGSKLPRTGNGTQSENRARQREPRGIGEGGRRLPAL